MERVLGALSDIDELRNRRFFFVDVFTPIQNRGDRPAAVQGSGLRFSTVRNITAGWVLTLPAAALLSGLLYCLFRQFA